MPEPMPSSADQLNVTLSRYHVSPPTVYCCPVVEAATVGAVWFTWYVAVVSDPTGVELPTPSVATHAMSWMPSVKANEPLWEVMSSTCEAPSVQDSDATPEGSEAQTFTWIPPVPLEAKLYQSLAALVAVVEMVMSGAALSGGVGGDWTVTVKLAVGYLLPVLPPVALPEMVATAPTGASAATV